jgi:hypothetical protein
MSSLLGPSYDYWKSIKQPSEMGMSPGFSLNALATNVDGLLSYVEVLISGSGNASVTGKPLGNKFFLKTLGQCSETTAEQWKKERDEDEAWDKEYEEVDNKEGAKQITADQATKLKNALNEQKKQRDEKRAGDKKKVTRWIYVNNIPDGTIPFMASGSDGRTFDDLRGLIPGALGNLGALSPVQLFKGFTAGTYPDCAEVTLQTVDNENVRRSERRHVALVEMVEMNPCNFPGGFNPASGRRCPKANRDGFDDMGSLAGSSGVAYQMSHRSPLSYNIGASKSSPMNGLSYDKFQRDNDKDINAKKVLEIHNNNVGSFYNHPMSSEYESSSSSSLYDEMIEKLSELMKPSGEGGEDLSDLSGDPLSQVYYYSLTAIMLYFLYRLLYSKRK